MAEVPEFPVDPIHSIFDVHTKINPFDAEHKQAMRYQQDLRDLEKEIGPEEVRSFVVDYIQDLDSTHAYTNTDIRATGKIALRSFDFRGLDLKEKTLDPSAVVVSERYVEGLLLTSLGYFSDPRVTPVTIHHLAKTGLSEIVDVTESGALYRTFCAYIPIDGSAFVEPAAKVPELRIDMLQYYTPELLKEVDKALEEAKDLTQQLRNLGAIDFSANEAIRQDNEVASNLLTYVSYNADYSNSALYRISGGNRVRVQQTSGEFRLSHVKPSLFAVGSIDGFSLNKEAGRLELATSMPFPDDTTRRVMYSLEPTIVAKKQTLFTAE